MRSKKRAKQSEERERKSETDESFRSGFGILAASRLTLVENRRRSSEELLQLGKVPTAAATVSDESDLPDFRAEGPSLAGTRAAANLNFPSVCCLCEFVTPAHRNTSHRN